MGLALALALALAVAGPAAADEPAEQTYDVVVYGGTAAGVTSAVQAARMGQRVVLVAPDQFVGDDEQGQPQYVNHLGGMTASGLSKTDLGSGYLLGGLTEKFYERVGGTGGFRPGEAEAEFDKLVAEAGVDLIRGERLDLDHGVTRQGTRIDTIHMESGRTFAAHSFIDASYEGDLMAKAGVSYTVGREPNSLYNESHNGVQKTSRNSGSTGLDPYVIPGDPGSGLLPGISSTSPGDDGTGDAGVQGYNYRMWISTDPDDRVEWTKPDNYDAMLADGRFELLRRSLDSGTKMSDIVLHPNGGDLNNNTGAAVSTDNVGFNHAYPDADHVQREQIIQDHIDYTRGFFWFLKEGDHPAEDVKSWFDTHHLPASEFADNGGYPHQLYVREGRRMVGLYVMTQADTQGETDIDDAVGTGDYPQDSHFVQRFVGSDGKVWNEGEFFVSTGGSYNIPYRALVPQEGEASNLVVPVTLSASHMAYGSLRMEPVYMKLGQSAGLIAVLADQAGVDVQDLDPDQLQDLLRQYGHTYQVEPIDDHDAPMHGTVIEQFNYGPNDEQRLDYVSFENPQWGSGWDDPFHSPKYDGTKNLTYDADGYQNKHGGPYYGISGGASTSEFTHTGYVMNRAIRGGMEGTVWLSALVKLEALDDNREAKVWFESENDTGPAYIGLGEDGKLRLMYDGQTLLEDGQPVHAAETVHLLLAKLTLDEDGASDKLELWINPDLTAALGDADLTATGADLFGSSLEGIGISVGANGGVIDNLRLSNLDDGLTQVTLVPEPMAAALWAVALGCLSLRRRLNRVC